MRYTKNIWEAYARREGLIQHTLEKRNKIKEAALALQGEVEIKQVSPSSEYRRYVAVDSAYDLQSYGYATEYLVVAVAMLDTQGHRGRFFYDLPEVDTLARVDLEEEFSRRILEGVGAALELILADRYMRDVPMIYLDGSFATFVIKLNALLTLVKQQKDQQSKFFQELLELGNQAVKAYHRVIRKGNAVACPKMSTRTEFYDHYQLGIREELATAKNDYLLLDLLLEEGDYVEVPIQRHGYNLAFSEERVKEELFESINCAKVYYLKGLSGKVYKFEAAGLFDPEAVYPLTLGKELLPMMEADRLAKDYLNGFLREEYPEVLESYRERR